MWHREFRNKYDCADVEAATAGANATWGAFASDSLGRVQSNVRPAGWAHECALEYIRYLCGEDCSLRTEMGLSSLGQMERQAASNLRSSFAVVGLLNETGGFFQMLNARVRYLDTSLNPDVTGQKHASRKDRRCA